MSEASSGRRETNPPPGQQSTQCTTPVTETNTEPIRRASLDRTRFLSSEASRNNTGASSSTEAAGLVCMPPPPVPVSASMASSLQGVRSDNLRDNSGESPAVSTAANSVRSVAPPPLSYFDSQRLGDGGTAYSENARLSLSLRSFAASAYKEFEDFVETDLLEGPGSDHEMTDIDARPALSEGTETHLPFGVDREGFFPALASTIPPPPALAFYPLGSPSQFSAAREMGAIPPLPINPAIDAPPPAALPIDPEVTLAPPLASEASEASYRLQQDQPPPGCHENLVAVEKNPYYSSGYPVPRFRTMSHNPWVIAEGDISIISGASMAGGHSTVVGDQNFGGPSLDGTEDMGTDGIEGGFIPISAITRPGFSDETLLSHSGTDQMQEWAGSAYRTPEPPMSSRTNTRYSSVGEPYLDSPVDPHPRRLSQTSTAPLSYHSYPINPLRIGEQLVSNIPSPATINPRATYSSYPPLPLPPHEQTYRPWSMDVSEDGTQFISLGDCDLSVRSQGDEDRAGPRARIGGPGGRLNTVGEPVLRIRGSKSGTKFVTATPPAEVREGYIDSSDSSSQQPVTKKQRTSQQRPQTRHTSVETSTDDASIADGGLFTGGKSIPSWMPRAVATEEAKRDAGTRKEQTMTPTRRDRKTQNSMEAVPHRVMKASTTAAKELTLTEKTRVYLTTNSTPYKKEDADMMDDDSFLASEERAVTPAPRRLTPIVEIIVPAVPRTVSKVLTGVEPVAEKRRSRGRPRKIVVSDEAATSEQNTITNAGLYTDPVVALGWLVPYNRGEPICLPGCESLPGTIGCLRCFDTMFPGRREREGLTKCVEANGNSPEMVFRRLHPGASSAALSPREAQGVQGLHSLPALPKASANKRLQFPALKKEAKALNSLSDPPRRRNTPTPSLTGLSERSVKKRSLPHGEASGARVVGRWSVPPNWEPPLTRAAAELSPPPTTKAVSALASTRRSSLSAMPTKNTSPALRERRSTISTLKPQALEKQTPSPASSRKTRGSTPARRKLPARDSKGKFVLLAGETPDTSSFTVEVKTTPKRTLRSTSKKPPAKKKAVVTFPGFHSKHNPECEDESGSEDESKPEDSSEAEDGSEYRA